MRHSQPFKSLTLNNSVSINKVLSIQDWQPKPVGEKGLYDLGCLFIK